MEASNGRAMSSGVLMEGADRENWKPVVLWSDSTISPTKTKGLATLSIYSMSEGFEKGFKERG